MEEILEVYRQVMSGIPNNTVLSYDNINLHFSGNLINLYDYTGEMPCGRYKLPRTEHDFIAKIEELNEKIGDITNNDQYICGKCGGTFDLPESTRDRHGACICDVCASGGDIRVENKEPTKKTEKVEKSSAPVKGEAGPVNIPSTVNNARLTVDSAISFLRDQGYVIKKSVKSFKVVASDKNDEAVGVTDKYYRSKEEFETKNPHLKFISLVKELSTTDEEPLD